MNKIAGMFGSGVLIVLFLLTQFPGGTIFMAAVCPNRRLDGWDWVLSVIVPAYGLIRGAVCLI
jgi:hypothetical protein